MSGIKWKKVKVFKYAVGVLLVGMLVCGCGKEETTVTEESNTEMMEEPVSETPVEEEEVIQEEPVVDDVEVQESVESTEMVDWETFAAQEGNEEICLAILNEKTCIQTILYEGGFYPYKEGDRIAIPIKSNIQMIDFYAVNEDGTMKGEIIQIYWKNNNETPQKYIEFEVGNEAGYYLSIVDENNEQILFVISTVAEIE